MTGMGATLRDLVRSRTARQSFTILAGSGASTALNLVGTIVVVRTLLPPEFGVVTLALAILGLASQLSDLGLNTGFLRFASLAQREGTLQARSMYHYGLRVKVGVNLAVGAASPFLAEVLARGVFGKPEYRWPLLLAILGAAGSSLFTYVLTIFQSQQRFREYAVTNLALNAAKVGTLVALMGIGGLSVTSILVVHGGVPLATFFVGLWVLGSEVFPAERARVPAGAVFAFSKWVFLSSLCFLLSSRLEVLLLGRLASEVDLAQYGAAQRLMTVQGLVSGALITTLLPKVTAMVSAAEMRDYMRRAAAGSVAIALALAPVVLLARPLLRLLFGATYAAATVPFVILFGGGLLNIAFHSWSLLIYTINKPAVATLGNVLQVGMAALAGSTLIPRLGATGAALASLCTAAVGYGVVNGYLFWFLRRHDLDACLAADRAEIQVGAGAEAP